VICVAEIQDKAGNAARKEYVASSLVEALQLVESDLIGYPRFRINDIWRKGSVDPGLFGTKPQ
jgi:hypothetical protein